MNLPKMLSGLFICYQQRFRQTNPGSTLPPSAIPALAFILEFSGRVQFDKQNTSYDRQFG
jgi:hypothetical protein